MLQGPNIHGNYDDDDDDEDDDNIDDDDDNIDDDDDNDVDNDDDDDDGHQGWKGQPHFEKSQQRSATSVSQNLPSWS